MQEIHLTDANDHEPHSLIMQCSCEPSLMIAPMGMLMVVHQNLSIIQVPQIPSAVETAKAILKNHEKRDN